MTVFPRPLGRIGIQGSSGALVALFVASSALNAADPAPPERPAAKPAVAEEPNVARDPDRNHLEEAVREMRWAQERIAVSDTGADTLALQARAIKDLDALIEQLKKRQQQKKQSQAPQDGSQPKGKSETQAEQKRQQQPENSTKQSHGTGADERQTEAEKAREASDKVRAAKPQPSAASRREQLEKDVWGHLPPAVRLELMNVYSEKFLLRYEELIQRYYESLAEQKKSPAQ